MKNNKTMVYIYLAGIMFQSFIFGVSVGSGDTKAITYFVYSFLIIVYVFMLIKYIKIIGTEPKE